MTIRNLVANEQAAPAVSLKTGTALLSSQPRLPRTGEFIPKEDAALGLPWNLPTQCPLTKKTSIRAQPSIKMARWKFFGLFPNK